MPIVQVGLAPVAIRVPSGSLENQVIVNTGPGNMYLGGPAVTPASGCPFPVGSKADLIKNGQTLFACVSGSIPATTPAVPASTTPQANNTGQAVAVTIVGGTVTVVSINGVTQTVNGVNQVAGTFVVPAGQSITLTYSVAPTWVWQFGAATAVQVNAGVQAS